MIVLSHGCIKNEVEKLKHPDLDVLLSQNKDTKNYLNYKNSKLYPYTHINGKSHNNITYYLSDCLYIVVIKECKDIESLGKESYYYEKYKKLLVDYRIRDNLIFMKFKQNMII